MTGKCCGKLGCYDCTKGITPEELAQWFHEVYQELAPAFNYQTREESAKPWNQVPENNRALMVAVCAEILRRLS